MSLAYVLKYIYTLCKAVDTQRCTVCGGGCTVSELSAEQKEFEELSRKFTKYEIILKAAEYDHTMEYPWDILKKA
jgi:hypothetical protein